MNAVGIAKGGGERHLAAFLRAAGKVRPTWELVVCVDDRKADALALDDSTEVVPVAVGSGAARTRWDASGVSYAASTQGVNCILNLANAGPWRPPVPSLVYQRNAIYFDPSWLSGVSVRARAQASARRRLAYRAVAGAWCAITPSQAMAGYLRSWRQCRREWRVSTIHHAVDADRFAYRPRPLDLAAPINLTVVSHPAPHKDFDTVVRALAGLRDLGVDATARFTFANAGNSGFEQPHVDRLCGVARHLGVLDQVEFLHRRTDVEQVYADCSVLVSSSRTESFGFPVLEAMASGTPIVASSIPASIELLGDAGTYFAPGRADSLVEAVLGLGATALDSQKQTLSSHRMAAEKLSWAANARAVASLAEEATCD